MSQDGWSSWWNQTNEEPTGTGGTGGIPKEVTVNGKTISLTDEEGPNQVLVDGQSGRRYKADSNGVFISWMDPAPSGGSTTVHVAPADTTGAWSVQFDSNGQGWRVNKITGAVEPLPYDKTPGTASNDVNGDGYDDKTGYPTMGGATAGMIDGKLYFQGKRINPDGSLMTPDQIAAADAGPDKNAQVVGSATTGYWERQGDGSWKKVIPGQASSSSSGGSSSGGSSSYSGAVGSGGGAGSGYVNGVRTDINRTIHEGGFTNTNISELGPEYMANERAKRGLEGLQSAGGLATGLSKLLDDRTNNIIQNLSNPSDIVAREYSTRALGNPTGEATPMYGDNAMLSQIISKLMGLFGDGSGVGVPAGNTSPAAGGSSTTPPATGGGSGTTQPPAGTGGTGSTTAPPTSTSRDRIQEALENYHPEQFPHLPGFDVTRKWDQLGIPYTQSNNPGSHNYVEERPQYDPATGKQFWPTTPKPGVIGDASVLPKPTTLPGIAKDSNAGIGDAVILPRPLSIATGTEPVVPRPAVSESLNSDRISRFADGGATAGEPFIAGDPQANGKPNPELVIPQGGAQVIPLQDMPQGISQMMMQSMPKHAYGDYDPNFDYTGGGSSVVDTTSRDGYVSNTREPAPQPVSQIPYGNDNVMQQVPQPTATAPTNSTTSPTPPSTPTQFGDWRDQLPPSSTTVPATTTTASSASGVQPPPTPNPTAPPATGTQPSAPQPNASNAFPATNAPQPISTAIPTVNPAGLGIHPYNGQPADTIMQYGNEAYQNLPSLTYAQGKIPLSAFLGSATGGAPGAFGTRVPYAGDMNYTRMMNLMRIPGSYASLSSLAKSANLSLDDEVAKARMRAPLGNAIPISGIMT